MILVDTNLLVYAYVTQATQHRKARTWLRDQLASTARVGLPWESLVGFVRLVTNPRLYPRPASTADAWRAVETWLESPAAWIPLPTDRHRETFGTLLALTGSTGPDVHDAHLAAIALQHGLTVCSADSDFAKFPGLRWDNPLAT